jgi:hypothetical protein
MLLWRLVLKIVDRIREHREAVDAAGTFIESLDPQHVAHGRACFNETEGDAAFDEFRVERLEHVRTGHVDVRGCGKVADDEPNRLGCGIESREHGVEDVLGVEIDDARFDAEGEDARRGFVVGMALVIRVAARAGDASEEGDIRRRRPPDEQHHRDDGADEHAFRAVPPRARLRARSWRQEIRRDAPARAA